jgi:Lar family restriction alleviation protein
MSDLREALNPCPFCGDPDLEFHPNIHGWKIVQCCNCGACGPCIELDDSKVKERWNERAAPAQPEAVEPVKAFGHHFWKSNGDGTESPDFCEGDIPSWKRGVRNVTPLYTTPTLAPDERMRRALEEARSIINSDRDLYEAGHSVRMRYDEVIRHIDEALSS